MENRVTQVEFARRVGVSEGAVRKAVKAGKIEVVKIGNKNYVVNPDQAEKRWRYERGELESNSENTSSNSYAQANLMYKAYKAQLAKLEYEERKGKLIERGRVKEALADACIVFRNRLLALARDLAPDLVGLENADEGQNLLEPRFREILDEFSKVRI